MHFSHSLGAALVNYFYATVADVRVRNFFSDFLQVNQESDKKIFQIHIMLTIQANDIPNLNFLTH
jgi:hypothetical protein